MAMWDRIEIQQIYNLGLREYHNQFEFDFINKRAKVRLDCRENNRQNV